MEIFLVRLAFHLTVCSFYDFLGVKYVFIFPKVHYYLSTLFFGINNFNFSGVHAAAVLALISWRELKMKKLFYGFSFLFDDAGIRRFITILRMRLGSTFNDAEILFDKNISLWKNKKILASDWEIINFSLLVAFHVC